MALSAEQVEHYQDIFGVDLSEIAYAIYETVDAQEMARDCQADFTGNDLEIHSLGGFGKATLLIVDRSGDGITCAEPELYTEITGE